MRVRNEEAYKSKKEIVMESCFNCFAENGLHGTGIATLSQYCHLSKTAFYIYFHDIDDLITQCTAYVMSKVVMDFVNRVPANPLEVRPLSKSKQATSPSSATANPEVSPDSAVRANTNANKKPTVRFFIIPRKIFVAHSHFFTKNLRFHTNYTQCA